MYINIDLNELAAEITKKIRDEMLRLKVVDFGEVKNTTKLSNGGWTAQVLLPGAENLTNPLNCLQNYIPHIGDWVMIIYPPKAEPVLIDCTPMRENQMSTPDDRYGDVDNEELMQLLDEILDDYYTKLESDGKYAAKTHDHDGRYYTKTISDERYAEKEHSHDGSWSWTAAQLLNDWQLTETGHNDPGYFKGIQGMIHLRGRVQSGSLSTAILQLPEGSRPERIETRPGVSGGGLSIIEIHPDGNVIPVTGDAAAWISLDGISFKP